MSHADTTPYELFAVSAAPQATELRLIGRFQTYDEALRVRDQDVIGQLDAGDGWYTVVQHVMWGRASRGRGPCTYTRRPSGWTQHSTGYPPLTIWKTRETGSQRSDGRDAR